MTTTEPEEQDKRELQTDVVMSSPPSEEEEEGGQFQQACHSLPCKIDFNGRAPVQVYFSPQEIITTDDDNDNKKKQEGDKPIFAAQFRGRQLMATEPLSTKMQGRLLEIDACKARTNDGKVRVKETFRSIFEWKHEHDTTTIRNSQHGNNSRVRTALEWCEVTHALHDPIPI